MSVAGDGILRGVLDRPRAIVLSWAALCFVLFGLLAPEGAGADHLKALSRIARVLRDPEMVARLRATDSASAIYAFLSDDQASNAA